jgi:hypothetical protein
MYISKRHWYSTKVLGQGSWHIYTFSYYLRLDSKGFEQGSFELLTVYKHGGDKFSFIFFIPDTWTCTEGESFQSCIMMGRDKQFICVSQLSIMISITIKSPGFIERERQFVVKIAVHKLNFRFANLTISSKEKEKEKVESKNWASIMSSL